MSQDGAACSGLNPGRWDETSATLSGTGEAPAPTRAPTLARSPLGWRRPGPAGRAPTPAPSSPGAAPARGYTRTGFSAPSSSFCTRDPHPLPAAPLGPRSSPALDPRLQRPGWGGVTTKGGLQGMPDPNATCSSEIQTWCLVCACARMYGHVYSSVRPWNACARACMCTDAGLCVRTHVHVTRAWSACASVYACGCSQPCRCTCERPCFTCVHTHLRGHTRTHTGV